MNLLELIRRAIRQNTVNVGEPVKNLHGASAAFIQGLELTADQTWMRLSIVGTELVSIADFYTVYGADALNPFTIETANGGVLTHTETQGVVQLYRGVVTLDTSTNMQFTVKLAGGASKAALYIDGVLDRSDVEKLATTRILDAGQHLIEIMAVSNEVTITTPVEIQIDGTADVMLPPAWASLTTGYADAAGATTIVTLKWNVDPRAGGWRIFRRQQTALGPIAAVNDAKAGRYTMNISGGNFETNLPAGNEVYANNSLVGTVILATYDPVSNTTSVTIQLPKTLFVSNPGWAGKIAATGLSSELTRIRRTSAAGVVTYVDNTVTLGQAYWYVIQAYSLFDDTIVSPFSEARLTVAGDTTPPASITFNTGYPQATNRVVRVRFHTPSDVDYNGVRVVYRQSLTGTVSSYSGTSMGVTVSGLLAGQVNGWRVLPTSGNATRDEKGIVTNTATTLTLDQTYESINAPQVGDAVTLYKDTSVVTDHGVPNVDDELIFTAPGYGTYQFRSFDLAGNEQNDASCLTWNFTQQLDNRTIGSGTQILSNPNFFGGLARYQVYDNAATGKVTLSLVADALAPNPSGQVMRVSVAANAGTVVPAYGGFYVAILEDGGTYKMDSYHKGAMLTWVVRAKIPPNYQINFNSNSIGSNGILGPWLTPQIGTGAYFEYAFTEIIGTAGTFADTGYFYFTPAPNLTYDTLAYTVDVAQVACYDALRPTGDELPTLVCTPTENGASGRVDVIVFDPRGRVTGTGSGVKFTTISGAGRNGVIAGSLISPGGVYSTVTSPGDVQLVDKLPSYVDVDLYGIDSLGNYGALLDHKRVTFGLGNTPLPPQIGYYVDDVGQLFINCTVDTDTHHVNAFVSKIGQPTAQQLAGTTAPVVGKPEFYSTVLATPTISSLVKLPADVSGVTQPIIPTSSGMTLNSGERYWIAMQSYNSVGVASDRSDLTDVYIAGTNSSIPRVDWVSTSATDSSVKFTVTPNMHCAEFEIYAKEFSATPALTTDFAVDGAYTTPLDAVVVGPDPARGYRAQPGQPFEINVPISGGQNWIMLTVLPYDTLSRQGPRLNKRAQGTGSPPPLRPQSATFSSATGTSVTNNVVLATTRATGVKVYVDNAWVQDVDVTAQSNGATVPITTQNLQPGNTYSFTYSGFTWGTGIESLDRTTPLSASTSSLPTIPQPRLQTSGVTYDAGSQTWTATLTPGSGSPSGVTWHLYRSTSATIPGSFAERSGAASTSTSLTDYDPMDTSLGTNYYFLVKGTLTGWNPSLYSYPVTIGTETATGPIHKTGYDEPNTTPTIGTASTPGSHQATLTWTTTDTTDPIYIEWDRFQSGAWVPGGYNFANAGTTTLVGFGVGSTVNCNFRFRVRHYNAVHNGPFSAYSNTVFIN